MPWLAVPRAHDQARRVPGESDFDLTWRMVSEFLLLWSDCLEGMPSSSGTRTMVGFYDTTFEVGGRT